MQHPFDFLLLPHVPLSLRPEYISSSTLPSYPRHLGSRRDMQSDATLEQLIIRWLVDPFYNFWFPTFPTVQPTTSDKRSMGPVNDVSWHSYISTAANMNGLQEFQELNLQLQPTTLSPRRLPYTHIQYVQFTQNFHPKRNADPQLGSYSTNHHGSHSHHPRLHQDRFRKRQRPKRCLGIKCGKSVNTLVTITLMVIRESNHLCFTHI